MHLSEKFKLIFSTEEHSPGCSECNDERSEAENAQEDHKVPKQNLDTPSAGFHGVCVHI